MTTINEKLDVADELLSVVITTGVDWIRLSALPRARLLDGHGVTIASPDTAEDDPVEGTRTADDLTRVTVDAKGVLADVLAGVGLVVGEEKDSFWRVTGGSIPSTCNVYFLRNNSVPPYAIRALDSAPLCVVLHVAELQPTYNDFAHALGVHVIRLKNVGEVTVEKLSPLVSAISSVRAAAAATDAAATTGVVAALIATSSTADPNKVEQYASTQEDRLFESAAAIILDQLFEGVLVLGSKMPGKPVPDGLVLQSFRTPARQAALYDCKSKKEDWYGLDPGDADQQVRYLRILDRLKSDGWGAPGIVMFTPSVDATTFDEKCKKDYCQAISDAKYGLRVVQAGLLKRWWDLCRAEPTLSLHFNRGEFWKALMELKLPGVAEAELGTFFGDRGRSLRLVTVEEAELCWLAGIASPASSIRDVADTVRKADVDGIAASRIERPQLIQIFHAQLQLSAPTRDGIGTATGLTPTGVRYLLANESFHPQTAREMGEKGVANLNRLRQEIGLSRLG